MDEVKPKKLIARIVEYAFLLALAMFLIKLAICWLMEVWIVLLVVLVIASVAVIGFRAWKNKGKW